MTFACTTHQPTNHLVRRHKNEELDDKIDNHGCFMDQGEDDDVLRDLLEAGIFVMCSLEVILVGIWVDVHVARLFTAMASFVVKNRILFGRRRTAAIAVPVERNSAIEVRAFV